MPLRCITKIYIWFDHPTNKSNKGRHWYQKSPLAGGASLRQGSDELPALAGVTVFRLLRRLTLDIQFFLIIPYPAPAHVKQHGSSPCSPMAGFASRLQPGVAFRV